ncbi:hypothetical protein RFI_32028 [Reticulomyxa filosa]|uniref:Uncharacterized protein n=1 Tax=Reticulomyxa filosa TaxID=46433 RepID=X6LUV3_RETFI|nr:hypothetical protein RFI_32028 [Reticulomyxa filosa]|eukprot:ETO05369.1 hypothetical protein RFI_32028 [Reticulomyxa filosa]
MHHHKKRSSINLLSTPLLINFKKHGELKIFTPSRSSKSSINSFFFTNFIYLFKEKVKGKDPRIIDDFNNNNLLFIEDLKFNCLVTPKLLAIRFWLIAKNVTGRDDADDMHQLLFTVNRQLSELVRNKWTITKSSIQTIFIDSEEHANEQARKIIVQTRIKIFFVEVCSVIVDISKLTKNNSPLNGVNSIIDDIPSKIDAALKEKAKVAEELQLEKIAKHTNLFSKCIRCDGSNHSIEECSKKVSRAIAKSICRVCGDVHFIIDCQKIICKKQYHPNICPQNSKNKEQPHIIPIKECGKVFFSALPKRDFQKSDSCSFDAIISLAPECTQNPIAIANSNAVKHSDYGFTSWKHLTVYKAKKILKTIHSFIKNGKNVLIQ